jgi:C4-dicarboxylate-specific signal transduction histidine kinase
MLSFSDSASDRRHHFLQLMHGWRSQYWFSTAACLSGIAALIALAYACAWLKLDFATAGFLLLVGIVLISTQGSFITSVILSVVAVGCLTYFFSPPLFAFHVERHENLIALFAFLTTSIIITGLSAKIRRLSEEEAKHTRAELTRYARVAILGELTASIAHEVNQPLAGVVSSGEACRRWLANQPPNLERATQSVERIIRDADQASKVLQRVRNLVKNTPPKRTRVIVSEAIHEVIVLTRSDVRQNQIRLETQFADDLPPVWVDPIQLQQVCLNLIVNAIESLKGVRDGPRDLLVRTERDPGRDVLVTISDTGSGLDFENTEEIFRAFYSTKPDGMGMGLAVSRSIIEAHGGRLWVSGNLPRGAKFRFTLPLAPGPEARGDYQNTS